MHRFRFCLSLGLLLPLGFCLSFFATSCKEVGPPIEFSAGAVFDSTFVATTLPAAQPHAVLIEDFTGVQCVNCPKAHYFIKVSEDANPGRINAIAIHSAQGIFSTPIEGLTRQDFRLPEANQMDALLGTSQQWPSVAFDRRMFSGTRYVSLTGWSGALAD
jgi:hypothetical protein